MSVSLMKKLTVLTPARDADALVRRLMRLKCVEIRTTPLDTEGALARFQTPGEKTDAEVRVREVADAIPLLDRYTEKQKPWGKKTAPSDADRFCLTGGYEATWDVVKETLSLRDKLNALRAEDERLTAAEQALKPWLQYDAPLDTEATDTCAVWLGTLPAQTAVPDVLDALREFDAGLEEVSRDEAGLYVSVVFHRAGEEEVSRTLSGMGFLRLNLASYGVPVEGTAADMYRKTQARLAVIDTETEKAIARMKRLSAFVPDVETLYDVENTTRLAVEQKQKLAATELCVLLEGWVPAARDERVAAALDKLHCAYEMTEPEEGDEPPVLLKNNGYASNFEWVVAMYSYPKYGTYDPTFIMSIFYFVIFGLMFADVGYGLILVLGGLLLPKFLSLKPSMKRAFNMFGYCGISSIIMGVLFGGWFGDLPYSIMVNMAGVYESMDAAKEAIPFFNGVWTNPIDDPMTFLVISLGMGAIHLIAGMAVKFYLLCKEGKVLDAIFDIASWWIIFAGIGVLVLVGTVPGAIVAGVGVLMIVAMGGRAERNPIMRVLKGLMGLYDVVNYASDLLSYSRILALGLTSAALAQVFNLLATMGGPTIPGILLFVVVLVIGHVLNIAINVLGAFVHTSRLQYLEFFNKFFTDGGAGFEPALPSEAYSVTAEDGGED